MSSSYYHSLAPFRELFATGLPILTYHKLGPRRRGVRLKGLYLSEKLFACQLSELSQAGFTTPSLNQITQSVDNTQSCATGSRITHHASRITHILLTFDDGFTNVLRYGLEPLGTHRFRAIQFLVAGLIGKSNEW